MNREEIEAAAKRAGLRVTRLHTDPSGGPRVRVDFGPSHHAMRERGGLWRPWSANGIGFKPVPLDEALAAIAADIDEIAAVRVCECGEPVRYDRCRACIDDEQIRLVNAVSKVRESAEQRGWREFTQHAVDDRVGAADSES